MVTGHNPILDVDRQCSRQGQGSKGSLCTGGPRVNTLSYLGGDCAKGNYWNVLTNKPVKKANIRIFNKHIFLGKKSIKRENKKFHSRRTNQIKKIK